MAVQVSYPGVYVQEVPSGARTITGVSTSIAAFVGMSTRGPKNTPVQVLGFLDYTRTFGDSTAQGEMTDQVRQFFTNGGQQAFVVRVGDDQLLEATATLVGLNGTTNLILTAISAGTDGDTLRAAVDFDTASPERTFNLTVFREVLDASGNATRTETEVFKELSMNPSDARYVVKGIATSALVIATVENNDLGASEAGSSSSGLLAPGILQRFTDLIPTTGNRLGKFRISVGGATFRTIQFSPPTAPATALTEGDIQAAIEQQAGLRPGQIRVEAIDDGTGTGPDQFLRISAVPVAATATLPAIQGKDVVIDRAADSDIAGALGLGVAQGGLESGVYQAHRPVPNGLVSIIGDNLGALRTFGRSQKSGWTVLSGSPPAPPSLLISGAVKLNVSAASVVFQPGATMKDVSATAAPHLLTNIRQNLQAIANAINNDSTSGWKASVLTNGFRLVLVPNPKVGFGLSSLGGGASFATPPVGPAGFADTGSIFGSVTSTPAAAALEGGDDGGLPALTNYNQAFDQLDKVDLFNILVLPRSANDTSFTRTTVWGEASTRALNRRAFLLVDPISDDADAPQTVQQAIADAISLRVGLVKDHSAIYWPRIKVNPDGNTRFIDPSGSVAGIMARIDTNRGVWKAPAGLEADLRGVLGVREVVTDAENGLTNPQALNTIRLFPNGIVVWGARTMDGFDNSGNDDFKYVPVRRFELFIEESLVRGLKFAVFEPNAEPLWAQIRIAAGGFMNNLFRQGAFAGANARDSFFVKCDSETTTQNDINLGIVNVVIGFAPLKPAEFVVITLKQLAGQIQV